MAALSLGEIRLRTRLALRLLKILLEGGVRAQSQRLLPALNRVFIATRCKLSVTKDSERIRRIRSDSDGPLCVGQGLIRIARSHQHGCVVIQDCGILPVEA